MGGSSNPIKDIADTVSKGVTDTVSTVTKGIDDTAGAIDLEGNLDKVLGGDIKDAVGSVGGGIADGFEVAGGLVGDAGNIIGDGVKYLTGDKIREGERKADRLAKQAEADAAAARLRQANERAAQLRTKAANEEAGEGSSIILGGKNKKKKGSKVSSGMGLSTGDTGLQV